MQVEKCSDFNVTKLIYSNEDELPNGLRKSLEKIAYEEGYSSYRMLSRSVSTDGGNYMASLYEVDIKGETDHGEKETAIFIKYAFSNEHVKVADLNGMYSKELFFYTDLSRLFSMLEKEAAVPPGERYKAVKSYNESSTQAIILQNLAKAGFTTVYRMDVMPLKFAEMSVQQLAKFHASSFIIEQKRPQYYENKIKTLKQSIHLNDNFKKFCKKIFKSSTKEIENESLTKLNEKLDEVLDRYFAQLVGVTKTKCLCHGDYRMNNILVKLTEGEITDVIPVDYQLLYYGSPVTDFIYLIFGATDREFRRNHLDDLKDMYFNTMENYLKYFEIDVETVYPRKEFERDYFECVDYGLQVALFMMPFFFAAEDDVPDFNKDDVMELDIKVNHMYLDRLKGVVDEMVELGKL